MENKEEIERRTFVGETSTQAFDGMAGFRIGRTYELRFTRREDGTVAIELDHVAPIEGKPGPGPLVVKQEEFAKWFAR